MSDEQDMHDLAQIDRLEKQFKSLDTSTKSLIMLLSGNPLDKTDNGIIGMVREMREQLTKLQRFKDRSIWLMVGLSIGAGWGLSDLLTKVL